MSALPNPPLPLVIDPEVASALEEGRPVVALESTVFSTLGLPEPDNASALQQAHDTVRANGAVPAMTAVLDGRAHVGVDPARWPEILICDRKVASRDLPVAIGQRWRTGVTTVSASVRLSAAAGVRVFATGGIGGVHRDAPETGDISADLGALAQYPVVTVCAGAKSFLDLARTLEHLEMLSVPVLGFGTDVFPAFTTTSSGLAAPHQTVDAAEVAAIAAAQFALPGPDGTSGGVLVAVPPPEPLDPEVLAEATRAAEAKAEGAALTGPQKTPFILGEIARASGGQSVIANIALVTNNARVASQIAVSVANLTK